MKAAQEIIEKLKQTSLEFTRFIIGTFMDYYGHPHAPTYLPMMAVGIDVENAVAALPGDGSVPVTFTYSADVGKFVAAALDLPQWPVESFMAGDKLTFNEMVKLAEKARGLTKPSFQRLWLLAKNSQDENSRFIMIRLRNSKRVR
ncbi:hypothetical protein SLS56_003586 [Neofusicoccum ribis]|uniref:NmrA-like domain-containing protein n=1 Tax=Neofusicoccum ribis TaxID=45134 RepID=A0ABR3SZF9_9PEZI